MHVEMNNTEKAGRSAIVGRCRSSVKTLKKARIR